MAGKSTQRTDSNRAVRDAEKTKQLILDAAEIEFAKHGLKGARTDEIAKAAGVASRMIYYYFQSKEGLYQTVLQRPAIEIQDAIAQIDFETLSPDRALVAVVRAAIAYEVNHRHRGMLLFQEASQNQGKYFTQTNWRQAIDLLTGLLEQGIKAGVFRPLDSYMTTLNIIGICVFYGNAHENLKHLTPERDLLSAETIEQYIQAAIDLVLNGVKNSNTH
ncbi:TetR/AcrR family transcriptional regulator [Chroococcidiopsis sp. FACHB-1243]|uniref:TetR family transcriptional regulator n=1 Tax=Chroococcidiopsis sp. [FACHB-1243] TaxID=2692781 RepID=UPI001786F490|nr:TetR/AcrR family transcriptional regulator [Chroococcidiopsis sp. [FACHB-1243]]